MSGDHEETRSRLPTTLPNLSSQLLSSASNFRNRVIGTITLTTLLVAIFQAEVIAANFSDYSSSQALLDSFTREVKLLTAATIGPFIHQGPRHLTDNLGVLIIAGVYLATAASSTSSTSQSDTSQLGHHWQWDL